ncbi:Gfo/Idh/MocA family protein [Lewinella sp. 4G2]|uniref:Gfo/Idh/MocA family protein n=1 Tax=Lewinella sp. 4G2 TaxID=1803372 RepID=UPI0007B4EBB7|nr:Gfo/Idh/MocA family oxidoreductase [Lewinella sp. 4G2]OAV42591.1 oxidoreductase [Lewinella sp. 4G2]
MPKKSNQRSRRTFLKTATTTAAAFMIVPRHVLGGKGYVAPSDTVNIAAIGSGGKGKGTINNLRTKGTNVNFVALCDVDDRMAADAREWYPNASYHRDFRKMLDERGKDIDAVIISTPDHTHAIAGLAAMALGKHVYIEKPLAHSIAEARALTEMALANPQLVTQMGNQGASGEGIRRTQEMYEAGLIGDVHTIRAFTNRPVWPQGGKLPVGSTPIPKEMDWNLWLGPAAMRPHHEDYYPFAWRGYWDFGTGALGDMGCHIIDTPFYILELGYPDSAEASVAQYYSQNWTPDYNPHTAPMAEKIIMKFPARGKSIEGNGPKPPVKLIWTDGGILPERPEELASDEAMGSGGGGIILEGTKGKLMTDTYGDNSRLLPLSLNEDLEVAKTLPRVETFHEQDWINGILQGYQPSSHLGKAGPLTETILMGNLAVRGYNHRFPDPKSTKEDAYTVPGRTRLEWDGPNMKVTNVDEMNYFVQNQKVREF